MPANRSAVALFLPAMGPSVSAACDSLRAAACNAALSAAKLLRVEPRTVVDADPADRLSLPLGLASRSCEPGKQGKNTAACRAYGCLQGFSVCRTVRASGVPPFVRCSAGSRATPGVACKLVVGVVLHVRGRARIRGTSRSSWGRQCPRGYVSCVAAARANSPLPCFDASSGPCGHGRVSKRAGTSVRKGQAKPMSARGGRPSARLRTLLPVCE